MFTVYFIITIFILIYLNVNSFHVDSIEKCMKILFQEKRYRTFNEDDMFTLYYGDPAIEVFNVLSDYDMKSIEYLNKCVVQYYPDLYTHRNDEKERELSYAGGNITILTGLFHFILPNVMLQIRNGIKLAIVDSEWKYSIEHIEITSIKYMESHSPFSKLTLTELENMAEEKRRHRKEYALVIRPHDRKSPDTSMEMDKESDAFVEQYLHSSSHSTFTAIIYLSDRIKYTGGTVFVRKKLNVVNDSCEEGLNYDEMDEDTSLVRSSIHPSQHYNPFIYSPRTTRIGRYVPEIKEMIVIDRDTFYGIDFVTEGNLHALLLEFIIV